MWRGRNTLLGAEMTSEKKNSRRSLREAGSLRAPSFARGASLQTWMPWPFARSWKLLSYVSSTCAQSALTLNPKP